MRTIGKRFEQFCGLVKAAQEGKTFIYHHPDMIAIDRKTWNQIQDKLQPRLKLHIDESADITPQIERVTSNWVEKAFRR